MILSNILYRKKVKKYTGFPKKIRNRMVKKTYNEVVRLVTEIAEKYVRKNSRRY